MASVGRRALSISFGTGGCVKQSTRQADADDETACQAALAEARSERKKGAAIGGEWRDTGKLIQNTQKAAGAFAKAEALARKAAAQGGLGQEQAAGLANVGNPAYLYRSASDNLPKPDPNPSHKMQIGIE